MAVTRDGSNRYSVATTVVATAAGMDAYVPKPIQSEVLVARLREVLQH